MMSNKMKTALALSAAAMISGTAEAAPRTATLEMTAAEISADTTELAQAKRATARETVAAFLTARGRRAATADSVIEIGRHTDKNGVTHLRYEQRLGGLRVVGGYVKAAMERDGTPRQIIERVVDAGGAIARPSISDADALAVALAANFRNATRPAFVRKTGAVAAFAKTPFFYAAPTVERVIIGDAALEEGFLVETWSAKDNLLYHTVVDGAGAVVSNELRTAEDSYRIFPDHPGNSSQTLTAGPGAGNAESPSGWLGTGAQRSIQIAGNNVNAYLDRDNNNAPDAGGVTISDGVFAAFANLSQAPTTVDNQAVAIQNLFYLNNVTHDRLYRHGFTESAGNFQENNFGKGGLGADSVNAEGQDGGGTNNANFATPADGSRPRMQMYLWSQTNPQRDGDLDSDIVYHEYGHGLTWRMIGGMSGNVSGAIGEGMSDVLAILFNNDDAVGEYSNNSPNGIRSARYANHPDTLANFNTGRGVHRNGELYAATIWDVWELYQANGLAVTTLLDDLVGGMNFTPSGPTYINMRDGILQQTPAARDCFVWRAFAGRGMGVGATMTTTGSVSPSTALPSECGGQPPAGPRLTNLTGFGENQGGNRWRATMTASVDNGSGTPQSGVVVNISTNTGATGSCTTAANGQCSASLSNLRRVTVASVTFTVTGLNGNGSAAGVPRSVVVNRP